MRRVGLSLLLILAAPGLSRAAAPSCLPAIAAAERAAHTAPGLLGAIGVVESGRPDPRTGQRLPWPWTVSAEGIGTYYANKEDAIAAVQALQARGVVSIDVGCMQVNLQYHPTAFRSLDQAFDPAVNATYAARFLNSLYGRLGDWPQAAAAYHSLTPGPNADYAKLIAAVWSGAPVPVVDGPNGTQSIRLPNGTQMRLFRSASASGQLFGILY